MNDIPVQLILAAFNDEKAADQALNELKAAKKERLIGILDAAVMRRDEKGKLHIKETAEFTGGQGALGAGAIGAMIGLIGGPIGVAIGGAAGALVGGIAGKLIDTGIPDERLRELGESLKPGSSAIVAIIEHTWVAEVQKQLAQAGADVLTEALKEDIAKQLEDGKEVTYSALAAGGALSVTRAAGDQNQVEVSGVLATEEGVVAGAAVLTPQAKAAQEDQPKPEDNAGGMGTQEDNQAESSGSD